MKKKFFGFLKGLGSVLFSLLLIVSFVVLELLLFIHALSGNVVLPSMGLISSDLLAWLFESWYSFAIGGVIVLIPMVIIILIN